MQPKLKVTTAKVSELIPYAGNAKEHPQYQIEQIAASIDQFGMCDPVGVWHDENGTPVIVEGHGRVLALKQLGIEICPVISLDHLDDEARRAYVHVHNQTTLTSGFDIDVLNDEIESLPDFNWEDFGFDIDGLLSFNDSDEKKAVKYFSDDEIKSEIVKGWKTWESLLEYVGCMIDNASAMYQFNRLCSGYNDGYNISLLFNPHRLDTPTKKSQSIFQAINENEKYRVQFARYLVDVSQKVVTPSQYYRYIGIGHGGIQYVNEFQPYLARDIYKEYVKDGDKVLNPCAGWGGRLIGLASCQFENIEYVETEPSRQTYEGLLKIKEFLRLGDNYKQFNLPFEDLEIENNYFDFVFTSPPYYDTELYSDDEGQSCVRYKSYDEWKKGFLFPMLDKIMGALNDTGKALLNVGNVRYPIDADIIDYVSTCYGVSVKRPSAHKIGGSGLGARTGEGGEPFLLFGKGR